MVKSDSTRAENLHVCLQDDRHHRCAMCLAKPMIRICAASHAGRAIVPLASMAAASHTRSRAHNSLAARTPSSPQVLVTPKAVL